MKPLGIDLGVLKGGDELNVPFVHPACPGARAYITREDLRSYINGGEQFEREGTDVPADGYGYARVRCGRPVHAWVGVAGHVVYAGLCQSCAKFEESNRQDLRKRKANANRREAAE
jgi:hypothetical protein